jgi:glutamyl-tRNA(Gln) amidotransferase subunit E
MKQVKITDNLDYNKLGLCCGLELHQQLDTHKLFCNCPSIIINDNSKADKTISRKLRAVHSESGEVDLTAFYEQQKDINYIYKFYNNCNCLVESDSQPPFPINLEALEIAIIISKLTNCSLVDKSFIMRKQVIDGSNVSGFQRTAMISSDGYLDFDFGKVRINKILLEEDSARPIERNEKEVVFSLDRLGIPLIELVVWHDIFTPEDVKKVALKVGQIFRLTSRVKRGLGTIRQDINVSIINGARVEIKGTQDLDLIPEIVNREVIRQLNLIEVASELKKRNINLFKINYKNISYIFKNTESKIIKLAYKEKKDIFIFKLENMKNILGFEIQPNKRVGSEVSEYLKKRTSLNGLFHMDELPNYGITNEDILVIKKELNLKENDSFIITISLKSEIELVKEVIEDRLNKLTKGVIQETRIVTSDGNTIFQRVLSGGARMYPETDLDPIVFNKNILELANKNLPLSIEQRKELYLNKYKISEQLVNKMLLSNYALIFKKIVDNIDIDATRVAIFLLEDLIKLSRNNLINEYNLDKNKIYEFFNFENFRKIPASKLLDVFVYFINNNCLVIDAINKLKIFEELDSIDPKTIVREIIKENKDKIIQLKEKSIGLLIGRFMNRTKGLIDGKKAEKIISLELNNFLENLK